VSLDFSNTWFPFARVDPHAAAEQKLKWMKSEILGDEIERAEKKYSNLSGTMFKHGRSWRTFFSRSSGQAWSVREDTAVLAVLPSIVALPCEHVPF
jgi:hypothetical protein